jgi:hypothetical protein
MKNKSLINWSEASRILTGYRSAVRGENYNDNYDEIVEYIQKKEKELREYLEKYEFIKKI